MDVKEIFRELHKVPEYGDKLPLTKALVCRALDEMGVPYTCFKNHDSVIAEVVGEKPGKTIGYRADMDALRIQEETGLPYASTIDGYMHACGHDAHTAIALCAAQILNSNKASLKGTVRFLFEAGEETGQGALHLLEENALEGVDAVFSLHAGTLAGKEVPSGKLVVLPAAVTAGKDVFCIDVIGKGGHGAYPSEAVDPVRIAANVIIAIQSIVSMEIPSGKGAVVTFGHIQGGTDNNSIAGKVTLNGTIRTQNEEIRTYISTRIQEIVATIPKAFGGEGVCSIRRGSNAVVNDTRLARYVADRISEKLGEEQVIRSMSKALMGSDDFARLAERVKGVYFFISTSDERKGTDVPNHNASFKIDEEVLPTAVEAVVSILENYDL